MELNFDKEMDALLRQTAKTGSFAGANGSNSGAHIDADAISAFAENALPDKTRSLYMSHLADCDRCRKILSNLIALNAAEPWPPAASSIEMPEIAIAPTPWYQKLLAFPNLAYTMGALVILFGGMIGFLVFQNMRNSEVSVSQADTSYNASRPVPPAASEPARNVSVTDLTSNTNSIAGPEIGNFKGQDVDTNSVSGPFGEVDKGSLKNKPEGYNKEDLQSSADATPSATPEFEDDINNTRDGVSVPKNQPVTTESALEPEKKSEDAKLSMTKSAPAPPPPPPAAAQVPAKRTSPYGGVPKDAEPGRHRSDASGSSSGASKRKVSGKTFNRTGGVWYDSSYRGQTTTDVRRGTDGYRKLDSGLRSIADNLGGTVVVVWQEKAYRIQ